MRHILAQNNRWQTMVDIAEQKSMISFEIDTFMTKQSRREKQQVTQNVTINATDFTKK